VDGCPLFSVERRGVRSVIEYLTGPGLAGRWTGTLGDQCASKFVAGHLQALGLQAMDEDGDYLQEVPLSETWEYRGKPGKARNVVGVREGSNPTSGAIIIGAHHDHLGTLEGGGFYPGADDNASGVAALLSAAEVLSTTPPLARTVVFITFTGEEASFQGSRYYLSNPIVPLEETALMINIDMVGRLEDSGLRVSGLGSLGVDAESVRSSLTRAGRSIEIVERVEGGSDHRQFADSGIPWLHVTTGFHADHHKPSDTIDKIDARGIETVAGIVAEVVRALGSEGG
jgi:Zn-dependent M28 family amino/carboxypeptidase